MKASVPISLKVIFISMFCGALGLGGVTLIAIDFEKSQTELKIQDSNKDLAETLSREMSVGLQASVDEMTNLGRIFAESKSTEAQTKIGSYLNYQGTLISFGVYAPAVKGGYSELIFAANQNDLGELEISQSNLDGILLPSVIKMTSQRPDGISIINTSSLIKKPLMTLAYMRDKKLYRAEIKTNNFSRYFVHHEGLGIYIVDQAGNILLSNGQKPKESSSLRSTKEIGFGLNVIVETDDSLIYQRAALLQYRVLLVVVMAMGLTFIFAYLFSGQFTSSLKNLHRVLEKMISGHFNVSFDVQSNDEIGTLGLSFKRLISRLQDRERLKNTLVKFTKPEDIEKILTGETRLTQEKKSMTLLVCDLHSGLDSSYGAEETIKHVNVLWNEISRVITKYLGFIDNNDGTFLKAVWGALSQVNDGGSSALSAALEIRKAINSLNERRASASLQPFKVGIGIHTGEVIAGQIGPEGRAKYTFVGDGPLYVAELAAATRELKADILISDETYDLIKNRGFSFGPILTLENFNNIKVHQVVGRKTQDGIIESELSKSEQETILTGSFQTSAQTQLTEKQASGSTHEATIVQSSPSVSLVSLMAPQVSPDINQTQVTYVQPRASTQTGYRFDNSTSTNSAIAFQTPSAMTNFIVQPAAQAPQATISTAEEPQWFLMRNPQSGVSEGPFTVSDLRTISEQPGFMATQAYSYRYGDTMMVPLLQVPGVSRREKRSQQPPAGMPLPPEPIQASARSEDWYVQRDDGQIYGPYSFAQLSGYLESGHISRNTYCWSHGMATWLYAYQVPGLDRRQNGPPPRPIPIPKVG